MAAKRAPRISYVVCLNNEGHPASLEVRKLYRSIPDRMAASHKLVRVIDESGDDYLYPVDWFAKVDLKPTVRRVLATVE